MKSSLAVAVVVALGLAGVPSPAAATRDAGTATADAADLRLRAIADAEYQWRHADAPGQQRASNRLEDVGEAAQQARLAGWQQVLVELDRIDTTQLSAEGKVDYAVYRAQILDLIDAVEQRSYQMPFNSDSSFWSNLGFMTRRPMRTAADYRGYIQRLADVPRYFGEQTVNMRAGLERGFTVPHAVLDGRDVSIASVAELTDPEQSTFYDPLRKLPASIPVEEQAALRAAAREAIGERLIPAYRELLAFFRDEYVPGARTTLGASELPDGAAFYQHQIREYTTLELSPAQIHQIGLDEVDRIQTEMNAIIKEVGFKGSFAEFLVFLRTDPQFYAKTPEELLSRAAWIAKRIDGELGKFVGTLPRGRFTIIPVPDDIAPFWTSGRGGNGTYWVNTYDLPSRALYNLPSLTLHEAAPGHAMQGALAAEQDALPDFRRNTYISAFGEGWGLYVEKLGEEMGIYQTPYEHFGRLTYEMWRAARLVIDTGVHAQGWTREQALAYLRDRTALSEHEVTTEVDRYISWPGQALSYKLGELAIVRLRGEAERELGEKFDIKAFHDMVLALGSVPLPVLETQVRAFIAEATAAKGPSANAG